MTASRGRPQSMAGMVRDVLPGITERGADLIDEVFLRIEADPVWLEYYRTLVDRRGAHTVNRTIGRCVKDQTGARSGPKEMLPRSKLIQSYTRLYW